MKRLFDMKMNLLSRMMLVFLLSAGSSFAAVDVNWLTRIVNAIRTEYRIKGQFCLAANIPLMHDPNKLNEVLQNDRYSGNVENTLADDEVYTGSSVVVAKPDGPEHAEVRVLKNLQPLINNSKGHFLLIYSYLSACGGKCTNPNNKFNILKDIEKNVIPHWTDAAFVFTRVFDQPKYGPAPTKEDLKQSLIQLGNSGLRLKNIFRCYKPQNLEFQCYSCSSRQEVAEVCVENNSVPQERGRSRSRSTGTIISRKRSRMNPSDSSSSSRSSSSSSRSSSRSGSRSGSRSSSRRRSRSGSRSTNRSGSRSSSRRRSRSWSRSRSRSGSRSSSRRRSRSWSRSSSRRRSRSGSRSRSRSRNIYG